MTFCFNFSLGVEVPEGQNDLRRTQLRELALLNGTLREGDGVRCANCGAADHKTWQCQDKPNVTNNVVCTACGGVGHIAKDCAQRRPGTGFGEGGGGDDGEDGGGGGGGHHSKAKMDDEVGIQSKLNEQIFTGNTYFSLQYMSLMAELGEGPPPSAEKPSGPRPTAPWSGRGGGGTAMFRPGGPPRPLMGPRGPGT